MNVRFFACLFFAARWCQAAEYARDLDFYAARPMQLFKGSDSLDFSGSFEPGDESPYWTWKGKLNDRSIVIELHRNTLEIRSGKKALRRNLAAATGFSDDRRPGLHPYKIDLFVKSIGAAGTNHACIESLVPFASKPIPFREVYLVVDIFKTARVIKVPERNGSCRGVETDSAGAIFIPHWTATTAQSSRFTLQYYRLTARGFAKAGPAMSGEFTSPDQIAFRLEEP